MLDSSLLRRSSLLGAFVTLVVATGCASSAPSTTTEASTRNALTTLQTTLAARPDLAARFAPNRAGFAAAGAGFSSIAAREHLDPVTAVAPRLVAELPDRADGALRLALARDASIGVTLTALDHAAVVGAIDEGRVVYRDVAPSADAVVASGEGWTEIAWVLRDERAPARFRLRAAPAPGLHWASEGGEGLALFDAAGRARLHIAPPVAVDAHGVRRDAMLRLAGDLIEVALDTRGLTYPIVLDPYIGTSSWVRQIVDPPRRTSAAMTTVGSNVILFGGKGSAGQLGDTWKFDGVRWSPQFSATAPSARSSAITGTVGGKAIVFGGGDGTKDLKDTWAFDGTAWTAITTTKTPSLAHPSATASYGGKLYTLGDDGAGGAKLWSFDGYDWTEEAGGLSADAAGYMAASSTELVYVASSTKDTWTWKSGAGWTKVVTGGSAGYATIAAMGAIGGTPTIIDDHLSTWRWTGSAWTKTVTGDASVSWSIEAAAGGDALHFLAAPYNGGRQELWACNGTSVVQVHPEDAPQVNLGQDAFAVYGTRAVYLGDPQWTWEWDGKSWSRIARESGMGIVFGMAGRGSSAIALLFGSSPTKLDTWSWNGSAWSKLSPANPLDHTGFLPWMATLGSGADATAVAVFASGDGKSTTASKFDGSDWVTIGTQTARPIAFGPFAGTGVLFGATGDNAENVGEYNLSLTGWTASTKRAVPALNAFAVTGEVATIGPRALLHTVGPATPMKEWLTTDTNWAGVAIGGLPPRQKAHLATYGATVLHFGGADEDGAPANDLHALTMTLEYGVACGGDTECSSGVCAQGVCCNRACDGTASRCDLKETLGTCTPLTAACTSPTRLKGADGTDTDCSPYLCQAGACLQKCATSSECAGGFICDTATSHCTAPAAAADDSGGCAVSSDNGGARSGLFISALIVVSAFIARRRRA